MKIVKIMKITGLLTLFAILSACVPAEIEEFSEEQLPEEELPVLARHNRTVITEFFDTFIGMTAYTYSQEEFDSHFNTIFEEFGRLHRLFTTFEQVEGINNLYTVNAMAGITPVEVDPIITELILLSKEAYHQTRGATNIFLGPVIHIWHTYRMANAEALPDPEALQQANLFTNIDNVIIDEENNTVFLAEANMRLDVGSIGKGFAIEQANQLARELGLVHFIISVGGDSVLAAAPPGRDNWTVGITSPWGGHADIISTQNMAVFTSGTYARRFIVDGVIYSHIIDPVTLMPADRYASITVLHESPIYAEIISLALFMMDIDEGKELLDELGGEALWIFPDGEMVYTTGYQLLSSNFG